MSSPSEQCFQSKVLNPNVGGDFWQIRKFNTELKTRLQIC